MQTLFLSCLVVSVVGLNDRGILGVPGVICFFGAFARSVLKLLKIEEIARVR